MSNRIARMASYQPNVPAREQPCSVGPGGNVRTPIPRATGVHCRGPCLRSSLFYAFPLSWHGDPAVHMEWKGRTTGPVHDHSLAFRPRRTSISKDLLMQVSASAILSTPSFMPIPVGVGKLDSMIMDSPATVVARRFTHTPMLCHTWNGPYIDRELAGSHPPEIDAPCVVWALFVIRPYSRRPFASATTPTLVVLTTVTGPGQPRPTWARIPYSA